jgi:hypothetical protein
MFSRLAILGTASVMILIALTHAGGVSAQYPPPSGNCTLTIDATQVESGGTAGVTVTVLDAFSHPKAGATVNVQVSTQPGSDASVDMDSTTTDANGKVTGTLHVGTSPGVVYLTANAEGSSCGAQVVVTAPPATPGATPQAQVAAEVSLPNTGTGTSAGSMSITMLLVLAAAGVAVIAGGVGTRRIRK